LTTEILEQRFQNALLLMFEGVLEMKIWEGAEGLERYIRNILAALPEAV
jgi:hypothetical protein